MAARSGQTDTVTPAVTVLQLDTQFPRVAGDVACPDTYRGPVEILRIPNASVGQITGANPASIPIAPFEAALDVAKGDLIVTSCGFLSYWQTHLQVRTTKPFVSSALTALPALCEIYSARDILTVTFDANTLNQQHLGPYPVDLIGLSPQMHLRHVIAGDLPQLDTDLAMREVAELIRQHQRTHHKHILLECTNLPPYKHAIAATTGLPITDILTCIEQQRPGAIRPTFQSPDVR